jgi:hypothetical protein
MVSMPVRQLFCFVYVGLLKGVDTQILKLMIKTILHIFDHTIKPILLYGSEIWGSFQQGDNYFSKKPVLQITRVQMFDVLSNEKSRKSRRGFDLSTLTHC